MPTVVKDPSPTQDSKAVASSLNTLEEPIMMMSNVRIATRLQDSGSNNPVDGKEVESSNLITSTTPPPGSAPLQNEKPNPDLVTKLPAKGIFQKSTFNPYAKAAQNYNIVEDLVVSPSEMSALEVLQSCPVHVNYYCLL